METRPRPTTRTISKTRSIPRLRWPVGERCELHPGVTRRCLRWLKGNRYQAERAAESRGISFAVQRESRYGETIGVTAMEHLELVRAWHGENAGGSNAALPIGALLCWSQLP